MSSSYDKRSGSLTRAELATRSFITRLSGLGVDSDRIVTITGKIRPGVYRLGLVDRQRDPGPFRAQAGVAVPGEAPWAIEDLSESNARELGERVAEDLVRQARQSNLPPEEVGLLILAGDELELEIVRFSEDPKNVHVTGGIWAWAWEDPREDEPPF